LDILRIIVGSIGALLIGGIWYSPACFGEIWLRASGISENDLKSLMNSRVFIIVATCSIIQSITCSLILEMKYRIDDSITLGSFIGLGLLVPVLGLLFVCEKRSFVLVLINAGHVLITILSIYSSFSIFDILANGN